MTEIHIRGEFMRPLHLLSVRGWVGAERPPASARLLRGSDTLEMTECFIERTDVQSATPGERAFGFWMSLVSGTEPTDLSVEFVLDSGEIVLAVVGQLAAQESLSYALPDSLVGTDLTEMDQVRVARGFLELMVGNRVWMTFLRQHGTMRHLMRRDHDGLAQDVKWADRAETFIAELLTQIFNDRSLAQRVSVDRLREHAVRVTQLADEAAPVVPSDPPSAMDHIKALYGFVADERLDGEAQAALGELIGLAARKGVMDRLIDGKRPFRRDLLAALSKHSDATPFLRAAAGDIDSPALTRAIANWNNAGSFDDVLTRSVLGDSALADRLKQDPNLVSHLVEEPKIGAMIAAQAQTIARVMSMIQVRSLAAKTALPAVKGDLTFSVVLGVYNGAEYLRETMDTILAQTYGNFELIAVDDQSNDETPQILTEYAKSDKRVRIVRHPVNLGQAAAMNTGVEHGTGQFVAFMDADDLWLPQKLAETAAFLTGNPDTRFFQHNLYLMFGNVPSQKLFRATLASGDFIQAMQETASWLPGPFTPTAGLVFSRELLQEIMPIPISLRTCSDGYVTRAAAALTPVVSYSKPLGYYRLHGENATVGNPQYDLSTYAERVLTPAVQSFYDKLDPPIWLGIPRNRPDVRVISMHGAYTFSKPHPIDERIRSAAAFVSTGVEPAVPFSKTLRRFLINCGLAIENSDFQDLFQNLFPRRGLSGEDDVVAAALECHMRMLVGDLAVAVRKLDILADRIPGSTVAAAMRLQAIQGRHEERQRVPAILQLDGTRGLMSDVHIDATYTQFVKDNNPDPYLQSQMALAQALGLNMAYFENTRWLCEKAETVDAWRDEIRSSGAQPRLFAGRRAAPPEAIRQMIPLESGPLQIDDDWRQAAAIDIAGATIFGGEWAVQSADGLLLMDLISGTPHHRMSIYGQVGQAAPSAFLVYPEKVREVGPCFLVGGDDNYFHWVHDTLPRLVWFAEAGYPVEMKALIGKLSRPFQKPTMEALGIPESRCIFVDYPEVVKADRVVIPLISPQNRTFRPVYGPIRKGVHDLLGAKLVKGYRADPWDRIEDGARLYIRRAVGTHRSIINEAEIEELFTRQGWRLIDPVAMTVAEQVAAFNAASVIVAPHGAALVNLSFCRPGTQVYEMAFPDWAPRYFSTISQARGLCHQTLYLRSVPSFTRSSSFNNGYCDPAVVTRILRQVGVTARQMLLPAA